MLDDESRAIWGLTLWAANGIYNGGLVPVFNKLRKTSWSPDPSLPSPSRAPRFPEGELWEPRAVPASPNWKVNHSHFCVEEAHSPRFIAFLLPCMWGFRVSNLSLYIRIFQFHNTAWGRRQIVLLYYGWGNWDSVGDSPKITLVGSAENGFPSLSLVLSSLCPCASS